MPIDLDGRHARDLLSSSLSTSIVRVFFIYFILVQTKMIKKKKGRKKKPRHVSAFGRSATVVSIRPLVV